MSANYDQNVLVLFRLAQSMCLYVKLESSVLQDLLCKSAWLDWSRIRFNQSKLVQIVFLQNFPTQPKPIWRVGLSVLLLVYKGNPKHIFIRFLREKRVFLFLYLGFCTQKLSKVFVAPYAGCVNLFVRSRSGCLHTYLGFPRFKIMSRTWWSFQLLHSRA